MSVCLLVNLSFFICLDDACISEMVVSKVKKIGRGIFYLCFNDSVNFFQTFGAFKKIFIEQFLFAVKTYF